MHCLCTRFSSAGLPQDTIHRLLLLSFKGKVKVSKEAQELAAEYLRQFVNGMTYGTAWRTFLCYPFSLRSSASNCSSTDACVYVGVASELILVHLLHRPAQRR